jgi:formyltetrahydrofolate synthetase
MSDLARLSRRLSLIQIKDKALLRVGPFVGIVHGGNSMGAGEMAYLSGVIAAFVVFAIVLGWAAHIDYRR